MQINIAHQTTRRNNAGRRTAHLTLTTELRPQRAGRQTMKAITRGSVRLGGWSVELDNPKAIGELARYMLATRIALHSSNGEVLTKDLRPATLMDPDASQLTGLEVDFLSRVLAGFTDLPLVFHVLPERNTSPVGMSNR
jgi:hypothetical protein